MKKTLIALCALAFFGMNSTGWADTKQAVKKTKRGLEGTVKTRIGDLSFTHDFANGYPTHATRKILFNEMDFQRATQAYLWAIPIISMAQWQWSFENTLGAKIGDIVYYPDHDSIYRYSYPYVFNKD